MSTAFVSDTRKPGAPAPTKTDLYKRAIEGRIAADTASIAVTIVGSTDCVRRHGSRYCRQVD